MECRDRLHVISCIFDQNLHTATITIDDTVYFLSCGSANCLDCWTPGLKKRYHSDDEFDAGGETERQIEGDLERQTNSWVDDYGIHDDNQSSVQGTIPASTEDHTSIDSNQASRRSHTSTRDLLIAEDSHVDTGWRRRRRRRQSRRFSLATHLVFVNMENLLAINSGYIIYNIYTRDMK